VIAKKKKLSRKQIQEDKLVTFYSKSLELFEEHKQKIIIGVGIIALIIFGVFWYINKVEEDNLEASKELAKVMPIYNAGSYQEAIDGRPGTTVVGLKEIVKNYGSTEQGEEAKIFLANSYYYLGKYEEARKYYNDYSGDNDILKAAAFAGIAACYEAENKYDMAAEFYEKAANVSQTNALNPEYLLNAGINYISANNKSKAKQLLLSVKDKYKNTIYFRDANRYLAELS